MATRTNARTLLALVVPALAVGIVSSLILAALDLIAEHWLHDLLWTDLPKLFGATAETKWWIFAVLTATGVAVGLVIWLMPGHGGPDPATLELIHPPSPISIVPSLLLAAVLGLAGGVSLGPEFPIMTANAALAVTVGMRLSRRVPVPVWAGLATAGTLGALFGTPIAAALMITESFADKPAAPGGTDGLTLWDRLFPMLVAAGAGSLTSMAVSSGASLTLTLPAYRGFEPIDLVSGSVIACAGALIGLVGTVCFPYLHAWFARLRHPLLIVTAGGVVLGLLGMLGGHLSLFKGLAEMKELVAERADFGFGALLGLVGIKVAAMLVAATSGFRGGRIFPVVFAGAALGIAANALITSIPLTLAIASGVLGLTLAVTRSGWLSIFIGAVLVAEPVILVVLCVAVLPAWLLVTGRKQMIISDQPATG
ncbi:H+/Cl- antiporter ClcA [Allocatelliglobosispora scoriae]|uniref:H+/Cl- antiporter ClcA n=1 Tax=Allocatelliglobosispora scoriae TaxID=643052 RepID=A0A841BPS7_9ACTN|nr:ion channel protein [Allocatelliglobosispora scoriae]MBB5869306.1 H+/Cl- antiporter ClcA [Allocatelliglobosispora scoriae]